MNKENVNFLEKYLRERKELYGEQEKAMFWLGTLMGEIARSQYYRGIDSTTVLSKLNFDGMDKSDLKFLFNEVFEDLKIYDLLKYNINKKIYAKAKSIFEKKVTNWDLSIEEGVFFILSGYSIYSLLKKEKNRKVDKDGKNNKK